MSHTILMIQPTLPTTRTYADYDSVEEAVSGLIKMYEDALKKETPSGRAGVVTYEIQQLFDWMETLADISVLVFQRQTNTYAPGDRDYVKEKVYAVLRKTAMGDNHLSPRDKPNHNKHLE